MKIKNLTPHTININGNEFPASGIIARVVMREEITEKLIASVPVIKRVPSSIDFGIQTPEEDTLYLVSAMVLDAVNTQLDPAYPWTSVCYAPDTGNTAIRNDAGHIVSVTRLVGN